MNLLYKKALKYSISKRQAQNLQYLLSLPYGNLINQLMEISKSEKYSKLLPYQLMFLSCRNDCKSLFQLSNHLFNKQNIQGKIETPGYNALNKWKCITQDGLHQLFFLNNKQGQKVSQVHSYFTIANQVLNGSLQNQKQLSTQYLNQILSFSLPQIYGKKQSSFLQRQMIKQSYINTLYLIYKKLFNKNDSSLKIFTISKILPVQLFNITDQGLIKDLYLKYLYPDLLKKRVEEKEQRYQNIYWLSRFGLPCDQYLSQFISNLNQSLKDRDEDSLINIDLLQQNLNIANSLYLILRKIKGNQWNSRAQQFNQLIQSSQRIINNFGLTHKLNSYTKNQSQMNINFISSHIQQMHNAICNYLLRKQYGVRQNIQKLYDNFGVQQQKDKNIQKIKQSFSNSTKIKILRCLLVYLDIYMYRNEPKKAQLIKQLLNSYPLKNYIMQTIIFGDNLAQIVFANQKFKLIFKQNLFNTGQNQLQVFINSLRANYCQIIKQLKSGGKFNIEDNIVNKNNNLEYLLTSNSRILINELNILGSQTSDVNKRKNILISLTNDNQFIGSFSTTAIKELIQRQATRNYRLSVAKSEEKYPFLPSLRVKNIYGSYDTQLYVKDNICKHTRIEYTNPHLLVQTDDIKSVQKTIKKLLGIQLA